MKSLKLCNPVCSIVLAALAAACGAGGAAGGTDELPGTAEVSNGSDDVDGSGQAAVEADIEGDSETAPGVAASGEGRDVSGLTLASTRTETTLPARGGSGGAY